MKAESLTIIRFAAEPKQTLGAAVMLSVQLDNLLEFKTVELPWKDNQRRISCIPPGTYTAIKHTSPKFGPCLWILDVPGRSEILIHPANYWHDLLGCIAPGEDHLHIDNDGSLDVNKSRWMMQQILAFVKEKIIVEILDRTKNAQTNP